MFSGWRETARFTIGVLLVWGIVSGLSGLARFVMRGSDNSSWRLAGGEFSTVRDFMSPNFHEPTTGFVYDREYQLNPGPLKPEDHLSIVGVDFMTLVMVDYDSAEESIKKGGPGRRAVDERLVHVYFISGPLSGQRGMIARYKLEPRDVR